MPFPFNRVHARYDCDLPVTVLPGRGQRRIGEGRVVNLGLGGALVRCEFPLDNGGSFVFRVDFDGAALDLAGRVVRSQAPGKGSRLHSYGVSFVLNERAAEKLKAALDLLRQNRPEKPVDEKMRWYWGV